MHGTGQRGIVIIITDADLCCFNVVAAVCGLVGHTRRALLGQASLSPMLVGEGSIPIGDVGFSPVKCDTD